MSAVAAVQVGMLLWCYAVAVFTDPGRVPDGWMPFEDEAVGRSQRQT